jgi:hypothetical protein
MEMVRWQARRSGIHTYPAAAPAWTTPIKTIAIWTLLLLVFTVVGIVELVKFVAGKLRRPVKPETETSADNTPTRPSRDYEVGPRDLVVLTSTGVVVEGQFCGIWSAPKHGLETVELVEERGKYALALKFRRRGSIHIPVPSHLTNDLREIADLLKNKT